MIYLCKLYIVLYQYKMLQSKQKGVGTMGAKYTEAQKKASLNYQKNKAQIKITVNPEQRDKYQEYAKTQNTNLTKLIIDLLEKEINK